ncbi:hypothetical protein [Pedobacter deserti]|uniref:hypothetical protein n=1 Tax=Pedobacter deserti TaxID=2817382 RepID=UPI002109D4FB|nr:hypothetical protein [Pedobacter sp. SYSU D00382]
MNDVRMFNGKNCLRLVAVLMLLLLAGSPVFQLLHSHQDDTACHSGCGPAIGQYHPKCEVCKHVAHHHPIFTARVSSLQLLYADRQIALINTPSDNTLVLLPGVSWSNKGPPVAVS